MASLRSFENAVKWSYAANWGERGFSALFTVFLAGILGPRDFGTAAIALIYIGFLQMFLDQGFLAALIQRKNLAPEHLDAVFWMNQAFSVFLVVLSLLFAGWWAARNHTPELAKIISVLSLCIPIEGLASVQGALLKREMDFKSLSIRSNISVLVGGVVGLGMALAGFRVWALVGQQITRDVTALVLLWNLSSWRPRLEFSWTPLRSLMSFSVSNFVAQLALFVESQASSILLGLFFGPIAVGLYRVADRVTNSIMSIAGSSIQAVSLPEFARLQDKPEELRRSVLSCIRLSSIVTLPGLTGLAVVSGPLMATLGTKWVPATGLLKILSVLGMFFIFDFFTGPLLQARSMTHQLAILVWTRVCAGTAILVIAGLMVRNGSVNSQIVGIGLARLVTVAFLITPACLYIMKRLCRISLRDFRVAIAPSVIASASIVASLMLFHASGWLVNAKPIILLIAEVAVGGVVGLAVLLWLEIQLRRLAVEMFQRSVRTQATFKAPI